MFTVSLSNEGKPTDDITALETSDWLTDTFELKTV